MKKIILLLLLPFVGLSQIEVKENAEIKFVKVGFYKYSDFNKGELNYTVVKGDSTLILSFLDQRYPNLQENKSLAFKGGLKMAKELQTILGAFYAEENKSKGDYSIDFKLDNYDIKAKKFGKLVTIITPKGELTVNKGNIFTLFGR